MMLTLLWSHAAAVVRSLPGTAPAVANTNLNIFFKKPIADLRKWNGGKWGDTYATY